MTWRFWERKPEPRIPSLMELQIAKLMEEAPLDSAIYFVPPHALEITYPMLVCVRLPRREHVYHS